MVEETGHFASMKHSTDEKLFEARDDLFHTVLLNIRNFGA